jgi:hypothetical protein
MSSGVSQLLRCEREAIRDWGSGWMNEGAHQNAIRRGCSSSRALERLRSLRSARPARPPPEDRQDDPGRPQADTHAGFRHRRARGAQTQDAGERHARDGGGTSRAANGGGGALTRKRKTCTGAKEKNLGRLRVRKPLINRVSRKETERFGRSWKGLLGFGALKLRPMSARRTDRRRPRKRPPEGGLPMRLESPPLTLSRNALVNFPQCGATCHSREWNGRRGPAPRPAGGARPERLPKGRRQSTASVARARLMPLRSSRVGI